MKDDGIIGTEQMYECKWNNIEKNTDAKLNSYECAMLNDFEL